MRSGAFRFGEKCEENPGSLNSLLLALQNDFRVLLVVPLWPI